MGLPVRIFNSTDQGAPFQQPTRPSEWLAILKKVLVEGYGAKTSLGWSLEFEDAVNLIVVFRQDPTIGSGGFLKVWSVGGDSAGTDIRIDVGKGHDGSGNLIERLGYRQLNLTSNTSNPATNASAVAGWTIVGCARGFWATQLFGGSTVSTTTGEGQNIQWYVFIGDGETFDPNDAGQFTIVYNGSFSTTGDSADTSWTGGSVAGLDVGCTLFATDGSSSKLRYRYFIPNASTEVNGDPYATEVPIVLQPVIPVAGDARTVYSVAFPRIRLKIPGLFETRMGGRSMSMPCVRNFGGFDFIPVRGFYTPAFWIKVSGEWYV
ncbi:hypothetical protein ACE02Z_16090 [Shewanella xiamenensis]|uniref:hypothetical protein n=1 Tax=Shewanella xiamenensis TaxID=332186 RepID=UPI00313B0ED2